MTSFRQGNDGRRGRARFQKGARAPAAEAGMDLLWGWHPVIAALENPRRAAPRRLLATPQRAAEIEARFGRLPALEIGDHNRLAQAAPPGAIHQGLLLRIPALEPLSLEEAASPASGVILVLDQLTDPQNVGAVFRSAAAFGARAVILQDRHAPQLGGALAKAAAGGVDKVAHVRVVNLSRALEALADLGWRTVGLDGGADLILSEAIAGGPVALVLGSEGEGLRRLVGEHCDVLARIPMPGGFESLNVSAAAAIALYEATRPR